MIGLDIGTRTVHVTEVAVSKGQPTIVNFGGLDLPEGAAREGEIFDVPAVAASVRQLIATTGIKSKKVFLGIANQRVVVRQIELPWMEEEELRSSLRFQVQEFIPIPVEDAELDFHTVGEFQGEAETRMLRLLLVAAHKDMVATHIAAAEEAGLRPTGVDLNPFATLRALQSESTFESGGEMLIDVGAGVTNIVIHEEGVPKFVRILVLGSDDITDALQSSAGLSREDAELFKRQTGLSGGDDDKARIIDEQATQFVDEVRNSLDYYQAQTGSSRITRVILTGGGSLLTGLPQRLSGAIRLPVELGNPFDRWPVSGVEMSPEQLAQVGPVLTTSVGLALGGTE